MKNSILAEPAFVGREKELEELHDHLRRATEGKGITVFVSGEAGAGKTRLIAEFLKRARQNGITVLSGWCMSDAAVPYFPFVRALNTYFSAINEEDPSINQKPGVPPTFSTTGSIGIERFGITAWLSGIKPSDELGKAGIVSPEIWKDQIFDAVGKTLQSISAQATLILFLEDIHWADSASLGLLQYISRIIASEKILVLSTFRSEELTANAEGQAHPLVEIMRLMKREDLYTEIKLANLDLATISKVAENMLNGSIYPGFAERLVKETQGNALYLVESLRMLSEQNHLIQENNKWRLSAEEVGIPSKFKDIVLRRLGALKFNQRRMLDAASVIGEKFDIELLGTMLNQDNLEVLETLNVISQSTSLIDVGESYFRFDHAKVREAIYEEIPLPLKKGYHARVAERLEGKNAPLHLGDIAYHYAQSGNKEKAVDYALAAATDELSRFANAEAIEHFIYVLQNLAEKTDNSEKIRIALEGLGDAYFVNGLFTKAIEMFERLANSSTGQVKLRAYRKAIDAIFFGPGYIARHHLIELAMKAEVYAASDRLESARIRFHKASALETYKARAIEFAAALQVYEEEYSLPDMARALEAVGSAESMCFEEKGISKTLLAVAMFEEMGDLRGFTRAAMQLDGNFIVFGLIQETFDLVPKIIKIGEKIGDFKRLATAYLRWGRSLEVQGRLDEALSKTLKALEYFKKIEKIDDETRRSEKASAFLTRQYAKTGNLKAAEEYYEELSEFFSESLSNSNPNSILGLPDYRLRPCPTAIHPRITFCEVARALGVLSAARGRWEEAKMYFKEAAVAAEKTGWITIGIGVKRDYAWALQKIGRNQEANAQIAEIQKCLDEIDERFSHVRLNAYLFAPRKIVAGEEFEMRLCIVNVSRKPAFLVGVTDLIPPDLTVTSPQAGYSSDRGSIEMEKRSLSPFQVDTFKLRLRASKPVTLTLNPVVVYVNEQGKTKRTQPKPVTLMVQQARPTYEVLPSRIPTGHPELDALLFGGIPEKYAVALASSPSDERKDLVAHFLNTGAETGEYTFFLAGEMGKGKTLAETYPANFYFILCNPQADSMISDLPNVIKLKGVENLTEIDIALTKAFRSLNNETKSPRRILVEIISDVLLQHHVLATRRWLTSLLPTLKSKGFTTLAVIDPHMHAPEEMQAIFSLFDGEIRVTEKETTKGTEKILKIRRMTDKKYLESELILRKEEPEE